VYRGITRFRHPGADAAITRWVPSRSRPEWFGLPSPCAGSRIGLTRSWWCAREISARRDSHNPLVVQLDQFDALRPVVLAPGRIFGDLAYLRAR
jgi:hypothetical protein